MRVNLGKDCPAVKVQLFTTAFRKVREDLYWNVAAGVMPATIVLKDHGGVPLASGLYYLVVNAGSHRSVGKILVIR